MLFSVIERERWRAGARAEKMANGISPRGGGWQISSLEKQPQTTGKLPSAPPEFLGVGQGAAESHRSGSAFEGPGFC